MQTLNIDSTIEGQRLDKYLFRYFGNASSGFIYKMMRKKNITLNKKKVSGNEVLKNGDIIYIFFSDETFSKFKTATDKPRSNKPQASNKLSNFDKNSELRILYENDDVIFLNKPAGILSQSDSSGQLSLNDRLLEYLKTTGKVDYSLYKPSIVNRLDRNTSGLIMGAKTYKASRILTKLIREHSLQKYYIAICNGAITEPLILKGYLSKDIKTNTVTIHEQPVSNSSEIITEIYPVEIRSNTTKLRIKLITGKTHQIRAHLSSIGHPIVGDIKYGGTCKNGIKHQLLHSFQLVFPEFDDEGTGLSGKTFEAPYPKVFDEC